VELKSDGAVRRAGDCVDHASGQPQLRDDLFFR
jgi:hypothetical protein